MLDSLIAIATQLSTTIVALATVGLLWMTSKYVRLTKLLVEQAEKSKQPLVYADFEMVDHYLRLVVRNFGQTLANDIRFTVKGGEGNWIRGQSVALTISDVPPFKEGISYLAPGRSLKYNIGIPNWKAIVDCKPVIVVRVEFKNAVGECFSSTLNMEMNQFQGVLFESFKDPQAAVADAIRKQNSKVSARDTYRKLFLPPPKVACPICRELILAEAAKCIHCGEWVKASQLNIVDKGDRTARPQQEQSAQQPK